VAEPEDEPALIGQGVLSRRHLFVGSALAASTATMASVFAGEAVFADGVWGHPFTFYSSRSRGFTGQWPSGHAGIDYNPGAGTPIHAVADGEIYYSVPNHTNYGEVIFMRHADGMTSRFAHMQAGSRVGVSAWVPRGTYLGRVGNTGASFGAHLHIEILRGDTALDPDPYVDQNRTAPLAGTSSTPLHLEDDLRVIRNTATGQYFMVGQQFVRHIPSAAEAGNLAQVYNVGVTWRRGSDGVLGLSVGEYEAILRGLGIPLHKANATISGGTWSTSNDAVTVAQRAVKPHFYKQGGSGASLWVYVLPSGDFVRIRDLATAQVWKEIGGGSQSLTISADATQRLIASLMAAGGRDVGTG
jgi:hypothetical protein